MLRRPARAPLLIATAVLLVAAPAWAIGRFSPSLFEFVTTTKDDGKDEAGGWQEASAQLKLVDTRPVISRMWTCRIRVGMPLRTAAMGRISPTSAAEMAADLATEASSGVMHRRPDWMTAEFCKAFKDEMNDLFLDRYDRLGARVNFP